MKSSQNIDHLLLNTKLATFAASNATSEPYGIITQGAIAISENKITWVGPQADLPKDIQVLAKQTHDLNGRVVTPGLIDCHTHLVYADNRADEFARRLQGESYTDIAKSGGGIQATVKATRAANFDALYQQSSQRLQQLMAGGVTALEIKSGYGLDLETEIKCLKVARQLAKDFNITIKTSYLGAHSLAPEFSTKDQYIDYICHEVLPVIAEQGLADCVDGYCDTIAFSPAQIERVFSRAKTLNLPVKLHAEQLSDQGGAKLAAAFNALSCDQLGICQRSRRQSHGSSRNSRRIIARRLLFFTRKPKTPTCLDTQI